MNHPAHIEEPSAEPIPPADRIYSTDSIDPTDSIDSIDPPDSQDFHRTITLPDGRYMIFYTFEDDGACIDRSGDQKENV